MRLIEYIIIKKFTISMTALLGSLLIFTHSQLTAQILLPQVYCDAVAFANPQDASKFIADLFIYVPHSSLRFSRVDGNFSTKYVAKISITNLQATVFDTTFSRTISTQIYGNTNGENPRIDFLQTRVILPILASNNQDKNNASKQIGSGKYNVSFSIIDQNANETTSFTREIGLEDISNENFAMSGILLVNKIRENGGSHIITPMITEDVTTASNGYFAFFETYNKTSKKDFKFRVVYKNSKDEVVVPPVWFSKNITEGASQQWLKIGFVAIPKGNLTLEIKAFVSTDTLKPIAITTKNIKTSGSKYFPIAEIELKTSLDKMRYVANQSDLDYIALPQTFAERMKRFTEFWQRLDPTPNTPTNEAMDEYYSRVEKADDKYSGIRQGRNTERGRVLIIFGEPDNINTDAFRKDGKTVETWYYSRKGKNFTFVDDSGFGDFRLVTPLSYSEKYQYEN